MPRGIDDTRERLAPVLRAVEDEIRRTHVNVHRAAAAQRREGDAGLPAFFGRACPAMDRLDALELARWRLLAAMEGP